LNISGAAPMEVPTRISVSSVGPALIVVYNPPATPLTGGVALVVDQ